MAAVQVSEADVEFLAVIRHNINDFLTKVASRYATVGGMLLDIAPQVHEGARPFFPAMVTVETFDINAASGATHVGDICSQNASIYDETYDYVVCTEVLEHTLQPFDAVREIRRILKPGGLAFVSTPFNFRIHGPPPDCWRFTENGLRVLFSEFRILDLEGVETPGRSLMPIQYTLVAQRPE